MTMHSASRLWGARCRKSARRVLRGGTGTRSYAGSVRALQRKLQNNSEAPPRLQASRPVPTSHRVSHDVLMGRLAKRVADKRLLGLIRSYLNAGIMADGVVIERHEGVPQGGPLSPLLANVLLDEVDKELERRGLVFCRYADDLNVYTRSKRAAEDAMQTMRGLFTKLRLRVNESKSAVARPWERRFLGYTFWIAKKTGEIKRGVASKALEVMKERVRAITSRTRGRSIPSVVVELKPYLLGWKEYFKLQERPSFFQQLDGWIRHRLRMLHLKHWKNARNAYRELRARGLPEQDARKVAGNLRSWWRNSHMALNRALPPSYFDRLGLPRLDA